MGRYRTGSCIVAFDFDGTLVTGGAPSKEVEFFVLKPDTDDMLHFLYSKGVSLILWTCRTGAALERALEFLKGEKLLDCFTAINANVPGLDFTTSNKIYADYYVDDLAYGWHWNKHSRWLPLMELLERDRFFDPKGIMSPGHLQHAYLSYLRL